MSATVQGATVGALIASGTARLEAASAGFGHGTANAHDEAAWLVLWRLGCHWTVPWATSPTPWQISL